MIDVAVTAIIRPELHKSIFQSFLDNIITKEDIRIVLNIDKYGIKNNTTMDVLNTFRKYFKNIKFNITKSNPNFFNALFWSWNNCESEYILQWEDDWYLNKKLYLDDLLELIKKENADVLSLWTKPDIVDKLPIKKFRKYNYCEIDSIRTPLPPAIIKKDFINKSIKYLEKYKNDNLYRIHPTLYKIMSNEKEFKNLKILHLIWDVNNKGDNTSLLYDMGRDWKINNNINWKSKIKK